MNRSHIPNVASQRACLSPTLVEVRTAGFAFTVAVCTAEAPISGSYFLSDVDSQALDGSTIFRIVNLHNQPRDHPAKIEVIQMGRRETDPTIPVAIQHEPTSVTGLRHKRGTVSLARFAPGAVYHSWFVCMRDESALDEGGARNPTDSSTLPNRFKISSTLPPPPPELIDEFEILFG